MQFRLRFLSLFLLLMGTSFAPIPLYAQVNGDSLCLAGERKIDFTSRLPDPKDQGSVGTCSFYAGCALAESARSLNPGEKAKPLSELYLVLKHFENHPEILKKEADEFRLGYSAGVLFGNRTEEVANSMSEIGVIPVTKNPVREKEILERLNAGLRKDMPVEGYEREIRSALTEYRDLWDWDSSQVADFSMFKSRVITGLNASTAEVDSVALRRIELMRSEGIVEEVLEAVDGDLKAGREISSKASPVRSDSEMKKLSAQLEAYDKIKVPDRNQTLRNLLNFVKENGMHDQQIADLLRAENKRPRDTFYWDFASHEAAGLRNRLAKLKSKPMDTKTDQKQLAFEAEVAAYFTAAKLENVSRLTPQQFASFSKEATAVLCEKNPYLKRVPLADCQAYMNDALFNIRMAMRHYQALKIAAAHGDFRTPAVIPSALGIDDPRYDFDPRSTLATERGRIPVCSESSWRPTRDSLLRELCAGQSVLIASSISQGLETAVLDANKRPTNQWKPIAAKKPKNDPTMTLASHATTIVGFDPQNGGYFLIRNSSGGDAVAYLRLPVNQVCHVTEAIAFTRVPPKFRADLPAPRDRRGLDH